MRKKYSVSYIILMNNIIYFYVEYIQVVFKYLKKQENLWLLTFGPSSGCGILFSKFDACKSGRGGGATVVGGAGVAIGKSVPSWKK